MLDSIGENICLDLLAVFSCVLLRPQHNSLRALHTVNPVYYFIKPLHLLELLGVDVEEILLDGRVSTNAHDDDTCFFVLVALTIDGLQHLVGGLNDGYSGTGWGD